MMKIGFWSPVPGVSGVSSAMLASAIVAGEVHNFYCSVMQSSASQLNGLQRPLVARMLSADPTNNVFFDDLGIDSIMRHVAAGDRSQATITDCGIKVTPQLFYIPSTHHTKDMFDDDFIRYTDIIPQVIAQYHTVSFFDIEAGMGAVSQKMLRAMDFVVICLPQNPAVLESFFEDDIIIPQDKRFYLFSNYDSSSYYNKKNLCKLFGISSKECAVIPHCTQFMDALYQSSVVSFFDKNIDLEDSDNEILPFIDSVKRLTETILTLSGVMELQEQEEGE